MAYTPRAYASPTGTTIGTSPAVRGFAVTPSDTAALPFVPTKVWVGGAGSLAVQLLADGLPVTLVGVPVGTMLALCPSLIMATGTTATNIVILG